MKRTFLLLSIVLTNTILGQNPIYTVSKTFTQNWSFNWPIDNSKTYLLKISGVYGDGNTCGGSLFLDAAFDFRPCGPLNIQYNACPNAQSRWRFVNNCQIRPCNDVYNDSHIYNYLIHPGEDTLSFDFNDQALGDNSSLGKLTFTLFEVTPITLEILDDNQLFICDSNVNVKSNSNFFNPVWSTGDTTISININKSGIYKISATDSIGCIQYDTIQVDIIQTQTSPFDTTICSGNLIKMTNISSSKATYSTCGQLNGSLSQGLLGWYPFCGNSNDYSTNKFDGIVSGATLTKDRFGNSNNAYHFDGKDYIDIGRYKMLDTLKESVKYSVSIWFKSDSNQSQFNKMPLITKRQTYWGTAGYSESYFSIYGGGNYRQNRAFAFADGHLYYRGLDSTLVGGFTNDNSWHHIVLVKNSFDYSLYFDNKLYKTYRDSNIFYSVKNFIIGYQGMWGFENEKWFKGDIDEIGIWNKALTPDEIQNLFLRSNSLNITKKWSTGDTTNSIVVSPTSDTEYWVAVSNGSNTCYDTCVVKVSNPRVNATADSISCFGSDDGMATASPSGGVPKYSISWSNGDTLIQTKDLAPGSYTAIVKDAIGCLDTQTVIVGEPDPVTVNISEPIRTLKGLPHILSSTVSPPGNYSYQWSPNSVFGGQNQQKNPAISANESSQIELVVVNNNGCEGRDTAFMEVLLGAGTIFPNTFSPNNDGLNDSFKPHSYFDLLDLKVYNAWGQCIYQSNGSKTGWDGTFAGQDSPAGAYVYQMQVQLIGTQQIINQSGSVTLVR